MGCIGCLGGDAFNLFVFLEISSLSSYALISMGRDRRALNAAFQYLVMGSIGATFILIGIGFLYMMTGKRPSPEQERIMDISLILHADHGINASTFASLVVASTLLDVYFSIGSGVAALSGPRDWKRLFELARVLSDTA